MEGLIDEKDDSASMVEGNFAKEPPDSSHDAAASFRDSRLSIGGNTDRNFPETTRIISKARL